MLKYKVTFSALNEQYNKSPTSAYLQVPKDAHIYPSVDLRNPLSAIERAWKVKSASKKTALIDGAPFSGLVTGTLRPDIAKFNELSLANKVLGKEKVNIAANMIALMIYPFCRELRLSILLTILEGSKLLQCQPITNCGNL